MDFSLLAHKAFHGNKGLTLENLDDELPEGGDAAIGSYAQECDDMFDESEHAGAALEGIRDCADQLAQLINRKEVSMVSLSLLRDQVNMHAAKLGKELYMPALESLETVALQAQATIALESFRSFLNNVVQEFVVGFKHHKDVITDFLKTASELTAKYEKKTLENKRHWELVRGDLEVGSDVSVGANGLLYFFAKGKTGEGKASVGRLFGKGVLLAEIKQDLEVSRYILTGYPKAIISEIKALAAMMRSSSIKTPQDVMRLAQQVEKLKTPTELFDSKYHGAEILGAAVMQAPKMRPKKMKVANLKHPFTRLSEMAGSRQMGYSTDKSMGMIKGVHALHSAAGSMAVNAVAPGVGALGYVLHHATGTLPMAAATSTPETSFTFKVSDIPTIFAMAEGYLDNVRACIGFEREFVRVIDELDAAVEKVGDSLEAYSDQLAHEKDKDAADAGWNEYIEACHIFEHVLAFANTLRRSLQRPTHGEVARALRASKYCNYLGLRAIYNADKKNEKPAGAEKKE